MRNLELEKPPVMGEDGWVELFGEIEYPDDQAVQIYCADGTAHQGHVIEFKYGYMRGGKILGYKLIDE